MGQQQSQQHQQQHTEEESPKSHKNSELDKMEQEIQRLRQDLQDLKQEGEQKKEQYRSELKTFNSQFDDSVRRFHACDREATSLFQFWDYLDIIRQEDAEEEVEEEQKEEETRPTASPVDVTTSSPPNSSTTSSSPSTNTNTSTKPSTTTTTLSKSTTLSTITTQFCIDLVRLFQSYLLRQLHMAMMLEKQQAKQAKGWNKLIMFYYHRWTRDDKAGKAYQKASNSVSETLNQVEICKQEKQDLISRILNLQQDLMDRLLRHQVSKTTKRRSSIEDIRQSKRELEILRYAISPTLSGGALQRKSVLDVTIQMMVPHQPTLPLSLLSTSSTSMEEEEHQQEESKEDREERPEMDHRGLIVHRPHRRSSIKDIKARTRQLEETRPKPAEVSPPTNNNSSINEPKIVAI